MQYGDLIACITENIIHHEMQDGKTYDEACDSAEEFLTSWIVVGEERMQQKENKNEEENEK